MKFLFLYVMVVNSYQLIVQLLFLVFSLLDIYWNVHTEKSQLLKNNISQHINKNVKGLKELCVGALVMPVVSIL